VSRSLRRGALAATALVFSLASLSACGAGNNAQTLGVKPDNAATSIGVITIQNAVVVTQPEADAEGPAAVTGTVFNNGTSAQTLDSVSLPGTRASVKLSPAKGSGPITVPGHGSVRIGGEGNASAVIDNGREAAKNGDAQQVVFTFSDTGDVGLRVFVFPSEGYYEGINPSALPSPEQTPSGTPGETPAAGSSADAETETGTEADTDADGQSDDVDETGVATSPSDTAENATH
jgi:hypothetical protein